MNWKGKKKNCHYLTDLSVPSPKEYLEVLLELKCELSKFTAWKVNIRNQLYFYIAATVRK